MRKNVASQLVSAQMNSATDGSAVTSGTCNVAVEIDGAAGTGGTATHIANGKWEYAPIQADTNGDYLTFQFVLSGAITQTVQVYTTYPQTGDSYARLGAPAGASVSADVAAVKTDTGNLVTRITSTLFSGITSLAEWLGALAGKQAADATAQTEIRGTGAGSGTYDATTDSQEAIRDRGDAAWITATGFSTHSAADVRAEMDSNSTKLAYLTGDVALEATAQSILTDTAEIGTAGAGLTEAGGTGDHLTALATAAALATTDAVADAIKAKTDSLTFTVAGQVDANTQYVNDVEVGGNGTLGNEWGPA